MATRYCTEIAYIRDGANVCRILCQEVPPEAPTPTPTGDRLECAYGLQRGFDRAIQDYDQALRLGRQLCPNGGDQSQDLLPFSPCGLPSRGTRCYARKGEYDRARQRFSIRHWRYGYDTYSEVESDACSPMAALAGSRQRQDNDTYTETWPNRH